MIATHRVNYDDVPASSATETVESANNGWTIAGDAVAPPNIASWQRRALSPIAHVFFGPDNNGQTDGQKADAPRRAVHRVAGAAGRRRSADDRVPTSIRVREPGAWDGGVVEISTDGGASWTAIGMRRLL